MPELPEVETTRRGIEPFVVGQSVCEVIVHERRLRWPIPGQLEKSLTGQVIEEISRRGKYLLFATRAGHAIIHLGMSGSLRIVSPGQPRKVHDHVDIVLGNGHCLRFHDPRRFGSILWTAGDPGQHKLIAPLGLEPLGAGFDGDALHLLARGRRTAVKAFLMDSHIVVGVGNIYATESLFLAGIHPLRHAGRIALPRYRRLADCIRETLGKAIESGGTTLRDFVNGSGQPGYFQLDLQAYGRDGQPCRRCGKSLKLKRIAQRATVYCPSCQT